jgi:RNA polymerase sigma factor (sigma-70 family)
MKDYNVTIKVRNNYFLTAMRRAGYENVPAVEAVTGICNTSLYRLVSLREKPTTKTGDWRPVVVKLADALNVVPGDLFPPQHLEHILERNTAEVELDLQEVTLLIGSRPQLPDHRLEIDEAYGAIEKLMGALTPREKAVVRAYSNLDGFAKGPTLEEVGEAYGVHKERVRQIYYNALRKMKRRAECNRMNPLELIKTMG